MGSGPHLLPGLTSQHRLPRVCFAVRSQTPAPPGSATCSPSHSKTFVLLWVWEALSFILCLVISYWSFRLRPRDASWKRLSLASLKRSAFSAPLMSPLLHCQLQCHRYLHNNLCLFPLITVSQYLPGYLALHRY